MRIRCQKSSIDICAFFLGMVFICSNLNVVSFGNISLLTIVTALFCVAALLGKKKYASSWFIIIIISLLILMWLSCIWSFNLSVTISRNYAYTILPIYFLFAAMSYIDKEGLAFVDNAIIFSGWIYFLFSLITQGVSGIMSGRFATVQGMDQNATCATLFLIIIIVVKKLTSSNNRLAAKVTNSILLILILWLYLMTGSRGGLIALVAFLLCISLYGKKNKFLIIGIAVLSAIVVVQFIAPLVLPETIYERLFLGESYSQTINSSKNRVAIWSFCFDNLIPDMPFWGYGAGVPPYLVGPSFGYVARGIHNTYLAIYLECGIVGLFLLISIFVLYISLAFKQKNKVVMGAVIGIFIIAFFLESYSRTYFWNILVYSILMLKVSNQNFEDRI